MTDATGPNADQVAYWNASAGPSWVAAQAVLDAQLKDLGLAAITALAPKVGETLIDIGCGCGDTTMELAQRVGPAGAVVGVDISKPMLELARARASGAGFRQIAFLQADAQTHAFAPVDGAYSRFGVMFFEDPPAAFANVRKAFRPGGRLAFVCWRAMAENAWMFHRPAGGGAADLFPATTPPTPGAPGPFAFADPKRVRGILEAAGFGDIAIEPHDQEIGWPDVDTALQIVVSVGALAAALRENPAAERSRVAVRSVRGDPFRTDGVKLGRRNLDRQRAKLAALTRPFPARGRGTQLPRRPVFRRVSSDLKRRPARV